jgi:Fe2+ or Zn2+ uptake regulation protein
MFPCSFELFSVFALMRRQSSLKALYSQDYVRVTRKRINVFAYFSGHISKVKARLIHDVLVV